MDLPEGLELPLVRGAPYWYWLGGRVSLDYVNTLRERWRRRVETLAVGEDLADWVVRARLTSEAAYVAPQLLDEARELREAIDAAVRASVAHMPPSEAALACVNRWLETAALGLELRLDDGPTPVLATRPASDPVRHALGLIAMDAAELLCRPQSRRIRICASSTCSARFYDRSPAAARQWCSPTGCGNRERARRHRSKPTRS